MEHLTSGNAALFVLVNSIIAKCYMSFGFRIRAQTKSGKDKKEFVESDAFKKAHACQLNDAEYGPLLVPTLLFLHSKGINNVYISATAMIGSFVYMWSHLVKFGLGGTIGATCRYIALFGISYEIFKTLQ